MLKPARPGRTLVNATTPGAGFQTRSSDPRVKSTAVEEKASRGGGGVILTAPRSMAARISRSDRIMPGSVAQPDVLAPDPQTVDSRVCFLGQLDQHPRVVAVVIDHPNGEEPLP